VFPKLAFLVIVLGVFGSSLLAMRQSRLQAYSELAQTQLRIRQQDEHLLNVRSRIAQAVAPTNVQRLAANVGPLKPLVPERTFTPTYAGTIPTEAEPRIVPQPRAVRSAPAIASNTPAPGARVAPAAGKAPAGKAPAGKTPAAKPARKPEPPVVKPASTKAPAARTGAGKPAPTRDRVASAAKSPSKPTAKPATQAAAKPATQAAAKSGAKAPTRSASAPTAKSDPKSAQRPMQKVALGDSRSPGAEHRP
jgi:hypothetical protein